MDRTSLIKKEKLAIIFSDIGLLSYLIQETKRVREQKYILNICNENIAF